MKVLDPCSPALCLVLALAVTCALPAKMSFPDTQSPTANVEGVPKLAATDWASIRGAYEAQRHMVVSAERGHRARNPGQQWTTTFDGRGFTVQPEAGGSSWGLELVAYGWGQDQCQVGRPKTVSADGSRLTYEWDGRLSEWYVNDQRGLEHGFTLRTRGANTLEPLSCTLAIRGGLLPRVSRDGRDVTFVDGSGRAVFNYAGLKVFDRDGTSVEAGWRVGEGGLLLCVQDRDARFPLTIDPIAQQAYVKASNTELADFFGLSVAIDGDTIVIGADSEDSNATGVNGNQADNSAPNAGAAYVFVRNGATWTQQAYLKASNTQTFDRFGTKVALSGDTIVVGALYEDSGATGVDGNQADNGASNAGAVYVFVRNGSTWTQQAYLKASNTNGGDEFGRQLAISGDTIVVGTPVEDSNATGVNGIQTNNSAVNSGAAYVFVRNGTTWTQQAYLKASNTEAADSFGEAVGISGNTIVVGALAEDSNATGVNGDQSSNSLLSSGAAYVFVRNGTAWTQQAYLKASNPGAFDSFAGAVAISGETIVLAAIGEDSSSTGVNGNQADNSAQSSGAAYVFVRNGTTWSQQAYLKASNTELSDRFGWDVDISGDTIAVGADSEDSNAVGINGNQADNSAILSGAVYAFSRSGTTWIQQAYLKASNTDAQDHFGTAVAVSGSSILVGAPSESSNATGVNGNQSDNSLQLAGAAYVFNTSTDCALVFSSPFGPGSLQMQNTACAAVANLPYMIGITTTAGSFPNGAYFGVDIPLQALIDEYLLGYPFTATFDATGASNFGPIGPGSLPSGLQIFAATGHFTPGFATIIGSRPPVMYTVP